MKTSPDCAPSPSGLGGPFHLTGKVALVSGAGRGIGKGCALSLARAGADLVLNERPGSESLAATVAEVEGMGRRAWGIESDAFSRSGCEALVSAALAAAGRVDLLVCNPAFSRRAPFLETDPEIFARTLDGTLSSGFHLAQLVARHMVERGSGGKIVFVSSVHSESPFSLACAYNAAKAGLNHLMRTIAGELTGARINVNAIAPGWIDTPGEREAFSDQVIEEAGEGLPWGRLGLPEDIGHAALFLCSAAADYVTGQVLTVDGGLSLQTHVPKQAAALEA